MSDIDERREFYLSDAHFGAHDEELERLKVDRFVSFLAHPDRDGAIVWFLGDLFDFWLEYRRAIPRVSIRILAAIRFFVDRGGEFHLLIGNHDFWARDYFTTELGAVIHQGDVIIKRGDKKILLSHGDGKAASEWSYRILRKVLRFRPGIWFFRHLPVDWAFAVAASSSRSSRRRNNTHTEEFISEYRVYAKRQLSAGIHAVIMGHLHHPLIEEIDDGWHINSGEWFDRFSYITREGLSFTLDFWESP